MNRVVRVSVSSGIIGMLLSDSRGALEKTIAKCNNQGYRVVQVIPDGGGNIFRLLLKLICLICTLFLWTFDDGYILILEAK